MTSTAPAPRIVFMGTPDFAVPALQALHQRFGVVAVVTVPDKPQGRGLQLHPSAVKSAALELGIDTILQPTSLKDPAFIQQVEDLAPDIICVIAFRILPEAVYSLARIGAFNVHASLLPLYRGAAPINHAIIQGDQETGVTSFLLNRVVDTGSILLQQRWPIADGTTAGELYEQLKPLAAECAVATCDALWHGTAIPQPQDDQVATPAPKVFRETARIEWSQPAAAVRQWILGHAPAPGAWTTWNDEILKITRARVMLNVNHSEALAEPGMWMVDSASLIVRCSDYAVQLEEVQLPGKKRMAVSDVIRGYRGPLQGKMQ